MNIGIIGSGNIGSLLAKLFTSPGHQVAVANSGGPQSLVSFAEETGVAPVTVEQVVSDKEIVAQAIPQGNILNLPRNLFSRSVNGTIVVDQGNYYPEVRDVQITEIDRGLTESEWVSQRLAIPIVKSRTGTGLLPVSSKFHMREGLIFFLNPNQINDNS